MTSEPDQGTTFVVTLAYRRASAADASLPEEGESPIVDELALPDRLDVSSEIPVVLLVEDNDELAHFITQSLPTTYQIHRVSHGADGFEQAVQRMPDLVLSDVLMPVMDGYMLCNKLKTDPRTSHIPVVLLTAKSAPESRVTGLSLGADDYITKPFHVTELQLRIRNLLDGRRRLREWVRQSLTQLRDVAPNPASTQPDPFLSTLYELLDNHLDDSTFDVDQLTRRIGMSRASLYRKIKAVADLPVNELIRNYRLKRATQYLRQGQSVSETAYLVGFESPSYFAKCFRDLYQLTPSEFAEER